MALKLSLKPDEKLVINGAVIANADRRTTLIVHNKASILREKDIMQEENIDTPAKRIYFPIMLMYMDQGDTNKYYEEFVLRMTEFMGVISTPAAVENCVKISRDVMDKNYYRALITCKKLIAFEEERLGG
ncbi:flagellar biosynthesis repressor FlbT [Kordiimonas aestuarii]|uniref:flagellar biosynthesis repressor FlbT n=1 Tax=Kordiimonas aestuarii TaxID=1005925 RepID=UPI0021D31DB9|nr:flagellar biosynthesis repressor FlbT [Kordiimonas aestuarii]